MVMYTICPLDSGLAKDGSSLRDLNVTTGAKMMVVGSTIDDVITVQAPSAALDLEPTSLVTGRYSVKVLTVPATWHQ